MAVSKVVVEEKDKFGSIRFAELSACFKNYKLNKDFQRRLDRIVTLFTYRRDVAHQLHNLEIDTPEWGNRRNLQELKTRLDSFKPAQFFLDALQTLLDEVRKDPTTKPAPTRFSVY